ncbi:bifunctional diaminohydroxyphosphoribosylaminopyrimidine deaminase/5-amino-6-(5-phosphoribosylamino)uracil reductase RibD [Flavobacterium sp. SE-s28]|uniref:Riboflavin biosynthesis protein RibD n=2 Tax=Flavobacterium silvaticum TaxID=1852020 RepID=A0A972FUV2_9FLAO|nr:bifunctional diaminohydroxyphosphoribosylaminopyrimidine deaminase/5-amino-6-(5-phosphoribosylamino)uracil reductase RibD [Flavobacterium silvaticum]
MARCLELAKNGLGTTYPNPLVGSVIVHDGKIIGEGWHRKSGEPHAEILAMNSVADKSLLKNSTIYVNLEPCSHFGKTPPCADSIIAAGIPQVVIGTKDPNPEVAGNGIRKLEEAGIRVSFGVLEQECNELNKRFFMFHREKRPYIILKWAQSEDGFIAPQHRSENAPVWISNAHSRQLTHKWRSEEQAILVGSQTVTDDNPSLTVREWAGRNPTRIVIGNPSRIPSESHIFNDEAETIVLSGLDFNDDKSVQTICGELYRNKIVSVIVEGGRMTLQSFIDAGIWDEARIFTGKASLENGTKSPEFKGEWKQTTDWFGDELRFYMRS